MQDSRDYWTAFAIGALVGAGATLLLSEQKGSHSILDEIEPALKRARKTSRRMRTGIRSATGELRKRGRKAARRLR